MACRRGLVSFRRQLGRVRYGRTGEGSFLRVRPQSRHAIRLRGLSLHRVLGTSAASEPLGLFFRFRLVNRPEGTQRCSAFLIRTFRLLHLCGHLLQLRPALMICNAGREIVVFSPSRLSLYIHRGGPSCLGAADQMSSAARWGSLLRLWKTILRRRRVFLSHLFR